MTVSITTNGNPVQVTVSGDAENNGAGTWGTLQLYRDSTAIGQAVNYEGSAGSENSPYCLSAIDTPSAGTYVYSLKVTNMSGTSTTFGEAAGPVIYAIELANVKGDTGYTGAMQPSGIVATGGTKETFYIDNVSYTTHTFADVGASAFTISSYGINQEPLIDVLLVGGGGGGGGATGGLQGGGGGAGCVAEYTQIPLLTTGALPQTFNIVVGAGGSGASGGVHGSLGITSTFIVPIALSATGLAYTLAGPGGAGGAGTNTTPTGSSSTTVGVNQNGTVFSTTNITGSVGGFLAGVGATFTSARSAFSTQNMVMLTTGGYVIGGGFNCGLQGATGLNAGGVGGGGSRSQSGNGALSTNATQGGRGTILNGWGPVSKRVGGGGGGSAGVGGGVNAANATQAGALFGGGAGQVASTPTPAGNGTANTGGGGGGSFNGAQSGNGGSGLVVVRYRT